jgi:uncharacterized membrane protein YoaK (UPF0700 family)
VIDMLLGIGEIAIIIIVTLALFLPELSKRKEDKLSHKFKLYLIIALLIALVLILSRFVFRILSLFGLLIFFFMIVLYAVFKKFAE